MAKSIANASQTPATTTTTTTESLGKDIICMATITSADAMSKFPKISRQTFQATAEVNGVSKSFKGELTAGAGMEDQYLIKDLAKAKGQKVAVKRINETFQYRDGSEGKRTVQYILQRSHDSSDVVSDPSFFGA